MYEIMCPHCGTVAQLTPDAERCPGCDQNLKQELPSEVAARYFYKRAEELAIKEGNSVALTEVQRGLAYAPSSELLLLAAILAERQGAHDLMRSFVAEMPLEDSLREEAEWLLRSHQMRQRALRQGPDAKASPPPSALSNPLSNRDIHSDSGAHLRNSGIAAGQTPAHSGRTNQRAWPTALALLMLFTVLWGGWTMLSPILNSATIPPLVQQNASGADLDTAGNATAERPSVLSPSPSSTDGEAATQLDAPQQDIEPATSPNLLSEPQDAEVQPEEVPPTSTPEPIVDSTPKGAILDLDVQRFDILAFLTQAGRPDLAKLSVDAQMHDQELIIYGVVPWAEHRRDILAVTQDVPGVEKINTVDLRVRVPATYTVQEGDTLWIIAYRIYDDAARWPEIVEYNQALIPDPQSLRLGSTLQVPPAR